MSCHITTLYTQPTNSLRKIWEGKREANVKDRDREHDAISKFVAKMKKFKRLYVVAMYSCREFVKKTNWKEPQNKQAASQSMMPHVAEKASPTHRDHGQTDHHCPSHLY
jgi:hypothetical protein